MTVTQINMLAYRTIYKKKGSSQDVQCPKMSPKNEITSRDKTPLKKRIEKIFQYPKYFFSTRLCKYSVCVNLPKNASAPSSF